MIDHLASRRAALRETQEVHGAVEAGFQQLQKTFAGDATFLLRDFEHAPELALEKPVDVTELLLLIEANRVFGKFAAELRAMLTRRVPTAFEGFARTEEVLTEAAADASGRAGITSHGLENLRFEI
jgi:hypothetical protein